ncbi:MULTISPECIES: S41 family peptidase [Burkholderia cepacia complex]|uniref:PDZ domain-containing protein n=2 Tax=Pseudomonadati TaxID=3379134 RepID=A0A1B4LHN7_9BURK|nr:MULTISPECIES: S41 family peptidase [Burkholderia cepacia complex]AOJ76692.1 hypothetical protein WJ35_16540 [Burkholderia ubonensis]AOK13780.1 hypothetical protein WK31_25995 [Burkholderia vietnamiensis]KVF04981.1 hypothetical protein WJ05_29215 [Burkholderia vietnamiensis]KVF96155.1 hypothetical protein WJ21_00505 [Burkholderia vietnamiensis]MBR8033561.1 S41 family peptidase [Burkholderia vietnamiensis]
MRAFVAFLLITAAGLARADGLPADVRRSLEQAFNLIKQDYAGRVDDATLMTAAIKGMVADLDPHSQFFERAEFAKLQEHLNGGFAGVGLQVGLSDGALRVAAPVDESPAAHAGIQAGDLVTRIDDVPTPGLTLENAVKHLRGEAGTRVRLALMRPSEDRSWTVVLTRAFIRTPSVTMARPAPGYGYVRISSFGEQTVPELADRLRTLAIAEPRLRGLVLDLRDNGGGVLQDAVGVASAFVPENTLVATVVDRNPEKSHAYRTTYADYRRPAYAADPLAGIAPRFKTVPLVVLTNAQSQSVTEVFAAALQDTKRAVVMGQPTFGKGTIQVTGGLSDGAGLMLTVARYYTPTGRSIQNRGVIPDIVVDEHRSGSPIGLPPLREVDLANRLPNPLDPDDDASRAAHEREVVAQLRAIETQRTRGTRIGNQADAPARNSKSGDALLRQALNWLRRNAAMQAADQSVMVTPRAIE